MSSSTFANLSFIFLSLLIVLLIVEQSAGELNATASNPPTLSLCGKCAKSISNNEVISENSISFACISPCHYRSCHDREISATTTLSCEPGKICSVDAFEKIGQICVPKNVENATNYLATCTQTLPKELEKACLEYDSRVNIICYNIPNPFDADCKSHIHCNRKNDSIQSRIVKCKKGYYDANQNKCTQERPSACSHQTQSSSAITEANINVATATATLTKNVAKSAEDVPKQAAQSSTTTTTSTPEVKIAESKDALNATPSVKLTKETYPNF